MSRPIYDAEAAEKAAFARGYEAGLVDSQRACREVGERGDVCDDPVVFSMLHESEAKACAAAIWRLGAKP